MSLEVQIETLNSNIVALINALQSIGNSNGPAAPADAQPPERPSKIAERMADEAPPPAPKETPRLVTLEDVKKAVLKLAARDRKAAVELLAKHGVKKVGDLPENVWTAVCFAAEEVLENKEHLNG